MKVKDLIKDLQEYEDQEAEIYVDIWDISNIKNYAHCSVSETELTNDEALTIIDKMNSYGSFANLGPLETLIYELKEEEES